MPLAPQSGSPASRAMRCNRFTSGGLVSFSRCGLSKMAAARALHAMASASAASRTLLPTHRTARSTGSGREESEGKHG